MAYTFKVPAISLVTTCFKSLTSKKMRDTGNLNYELYTQTFSDRKIQNI